MPGGSSSTAAVVPTRLPPTCQTAGRGQRRLLLLFWSSTRCKTWRGWLLRPRMLCPPLFARSVSYLHPSLTPCSLPAPSLRHRLLATALAARWLFDKAIGVCPLCGNTCGPVAMCVCVCVCV